MKDNKRYMAGRVFCFPCSFPLRYTFTIIPICSLTLLSLPHTDCASALREGEADLRRISETRAWGRQGQVECRDE